MDFGKAPLSDLQFLVMQEVAALYPDRAVFDHADKGRDVYKRQGAGIYCSPAVEKDKVFVGDDMGQLTAYALKNGKKIWTSFAVAPFGKVKGCWTLPIARPVSYTHLDVYKRQGGLTRMHFSPAAVWPVATDGKVFITDPQREMCIRDRNYTHQTLYKLPIPPSPNLPNMKSIYLYPSTCYFEATPVSLGSCLLYTSRCV